MGTQAHVPVAAAATPAPAFAAQPASTVAGAPAAPAAATAASSAAPDAGVEIPATAAGRADAASAPAASGAAAPAPALANTAASDAPDAAIDIAAATTASATTASAATAIAANAPATEAPVADAPAEAAPATFDTFGLHPSILQAIVATGYTVPTPIQAKAIPVVIAGADVMGAAQTGTGKTAAFTLPILHRLMPMANASASPARHPVRALILTPTRELADQVADNVKRYSKFTPLRAAVVFGGVDIVPQKAELRAGCEVLIATPGRLLDHVEQKTVNLSQVGMLVLDEADRMLDMGFLPDLERIMRLLPEKRQTLLFSATFSNEIRRLGHTFLKQPIEIETAARNATSDNVTQIAYALSSDAKRAAVVHLVKSRNLNQVIVFSNTKIGTARLARQLELDGVRAESIHGDKTQTDRMKALEAFKAGTLEVLVATDVAARGLDVAGVPCVINYDLPHSAEDYVHRIGRTGRAGARGEAIALYTPEEEKYLIDIEKLIKRTVPRATLDLPVTPGSLRASRETREGREPRRDSRREGGREGVRDTTRDAARDVGVTPEASRDVSSVVAQEGARDAGRDRVASVSRDNSRSAAAGASSPRSYDRPERSGSRDSRSSGRGGRSAPVDDFFSKPYVPSPSANRDTTPATDAAPSRPGPKRQLAALLGGGKKS
jgi:superfamily II DNA/RNA helicase